MDPKALHQRHGQQVHSFVFQNSATYTTHKYMPSLFSSYFYTGGENLYCTNFTKKCLNAFSTMHIAHFVENQMHLIKNK